VLRTNPVHVLQTFAEAGRHALRTALEAYAAHGIDLSPAARKFAEARGIDVQSPERDDPPGVVGLLYQRDHGPGFVTPLVVHLADDWFVAPNLPFGQADVHLALKRLLLAGGGNLVDLHADLFAFAIHDRAGYAADGDSMTIAGLLALLVAVAGDPKGHFRTACAVVEPGKEDALQGVGSNTVTAKLDAFIREYECGTLLVRPRHCAHAAAYDCYFKEVWKIDSYAELADHAEAAGLLAGFRRQTPLNRVHFDRARDQLQHQAVHQHHYQVVLPLARKLLQYPLGADVPPSSVGELRQLVLDLQRHLGRLRDAVDSAETEVQQLAQPESQASYDAQARAAAALGSALYDAHRFGEARALLRRWQRRLEQTPAIVSALARVMVWNTLGRIEAVAGGPWPARFDASLKVLEVSDPPDRARTHSYFAHALLRHGRLAESERIITEGERCPGAAGMPRWMLAFSRADLARRRGRHQWINQEMDGRQPFRGPTGHPFGMYLQATARQADRTIADRVDRLDRSAAFFEIDVVGSRGRNLLSFLAACIRLRAAAVMGVGQTWRALRKQLRSYLAEPSFARHYGAAWIALGREPALEPIEALLELVPYF
jgi:hypothetical protein